MTSSLGLGAYTEGAAVILGISAAISAAKTWYDGLALDEDLVEVLQDDGMDEEANLVARAVAAAGHPKYEKKLSSL